MVLVSWCANTIKAFPPTDEVGSEVVSTNASQLSQATYAKSLNKMNFTIAQGLELSLAVEDGLIQWPIAATQDRNGDLLILECHWNGESVEKQLVSKPHKIVRLSDTNGDRIFDKRFVIATDLGFPEGIMVMGDDLLVSSPPNLLRLSDSDKDGVYEKHDVWFDGMTLTFCANDLHGPMMGPDGWVYWTKGAFGEQNHDLIRKPIEKQVSAVASKAAHIYRRHPNGGPIERLMTGGMDNPSDLTFSPEGDIFFCSTFLHHPGNGLRDGIAQSPRGGLFGKQHQVLDGHWETGPLLQPIANLGPAAPASVNYLSSKSIPSSLWGGPSGNLELLASPYLASAQFNLQKIGLHRLIPIGSSFETQTMDLLSADRIDFHPVDIIEESDGSLLVFDTGSWYDLCCPSSGSDRTIEKGGIYRLTPNDRSTGLTASSQLDLSIEAAQQILLNQKAETTDRVQSLWQISRQITQATAGSTSKRVVLAMLNDANPSIQQAAARIVGLNRWPEAKPSLEKMLSSPSAAVVRAAIESLGIVGDVSSIEKIVGGATRFVEDRMLEHACIYALLELEQRPALVRLLKQDRLTHEERYLTLYALQQMGSLPDELVSDLARLLDSPNERLRALVVRNLVTSTSGMNHCLGFLRKAWEHEDEATLNMCIPIVQAARTNDGGIALVETWLRSASSESVIRQRWLQSAIERMSGERLPDAWAVGIVGWLGNSLDTNTMESLANTVRKIDFSSEQKDDASKTIRKIARKNLENLKLALALIAASPESQTVLEDEVAGIVIEELGRVDGELMAVAEAALGRSVLSVDQAKMLIATLDRIAPLSLQTAINSLLRCRSDAIDRELLERLPQVASVKTLSADRVLASVNDRSEEVKSTWKAMLVKASKPPEDIEKSLEDWLARLPNGDPQRGYEVYRSSKSACSNCHQIGYIGGRLGPELSQIGKTRTRRDLIASIVFPSLHLAQGYYPIRIRTNEGEVINGLLSKQTDDYIELVCGVDKISRIAREDIEEQAESKLSVMPMGLEQQLSLQEFADLITYLESKK